MITLWPRERSTSIRVLARKPVPPVMRIWDILLLFLLVDWMIRMVIVWCGEGELDGVKRIYLYYYKVSLILKAGSISKHILSNW